MFCCFFPDWRKTDQHKVREQKLLDVLVSLTRKNEFKVDGTSFSDAGSLVTTAHLTREI